MTSSHDARLARALDLSTRYPASASLLRFYSEVARFQKPIFEEFKAKNETDWHRLVCFFPDLIQVVAHTGTEVLADFAAGHLRTQNAQWDLLSAVWEGGAAVEPAGRFYGRALLQPFAEYLASRGDIDTTTASPTCPFCNARPVAGVLRGEGEGGKRWLLCSLCSTEWQYRRVLCPGCGEENKDKLPIYTATEFPAVRVDACDTCHTYLKSIDLTKDGHAIPVVDEIATVALNIWAEDHDYAKLETNLLGM